MGRQRLEQRPGAPKRQVAAAVQTLRGVYDEGTKLRNRLTKAMQHGARKMAWVEREAATRGTNRDYVWKAIMFADPETGVTHDELDQLCRLVRSHERVVGRAFVAKLVSVPKKDRMKRAEEILRSGLTVSEIDAMLTRRYGRRRQGGRRPRMLANKQDTLIGLDGLCVSWRRLVDFLNDSHTARSSRSSVRLDCLPDDVRVAVQVVGKTMGVLREALDQHLRKATVR